MGGWTNRDISYFKRKGEKSLVTPVGGKFQAILFVKLILTSCRLQLAKQNIRNWSFHIHRLHVYLGVDRV